MLEYGHAQILLSSTHGKNQEHGREKGEDSRKVRKRGCLGSAQSKKVAGARGKEAEEWMRARIPSAGGANEGGGRWTGVEATIASGSVHVGE